MYGKDVSLAYVDTDSFLLDFKKVDLRDEIGMVDLKISWI